MFKRKKWFIIRRKIMEDIKRNIEDIRKNIEKAAAVSGRKAEDILLLGVTKTVDVERIKELVRCGVKTFGENRVQELISKYDCFENDVKWHLIGSLQTNKVKYIIDKVELIHSLDSVRLASEIDRQAKKYGKIMEVLVEINIAGEKSKHGVLLEDVDKLIQEISIFDNIRLKGLMTVAPFVENPQENRKYFNQMRKKFIDIASQNVDNIDMTYLSMGMTNDYQVAIEEGANIVRIGTGIFGRRNYDL